MGPLFFKRWEEEEELEKIPDKKPPASRRSREKGQSYQDARFPKGKRVPNVSGMLSKLKQGEKFSERGRNRNGI